MQVHNDNDDFEKECKRFNHWIQTYGITLDEWLTSNLTDKELEEKLKHLT